VEDLADRRPAPPRLARCPRTRRARGAHRVRRTFSRCRGRAASFEGSRARTSSPSDSPMP
jgi:hypothetical protein